MIGRGHEDDDDHMDEMNENFSLTIRGFYVPPGLRSLFEVICGNVSQNCGGSPSSFFEEVVYRVASQKADG